MNRTVEFIYEEQQQDQEDSRTMFWFYTVQKEFEYCQAKRLIST